MDFFHRAGNQVFQPLSETFLFQHILMFSFDLKTENKKITWNVKLFVRNTRSTQRETKKESFVLPLVCFHVFLSSLVIQTVWIMDDKEDTPPPLHSLCLRYTRMAENSAAVLMWCEIKSTLERRHLFYFMWWSLHPACNSIRLSAARHRTLFQTWWCTCDCIKEILIIRYDTVASDYSCRVEDRTETGSRK